MELLLILAILATLSGGRELSLDDLKRRTFRYFWELAHPVTGLIPDRAPTPTFSSVAAQGFGLTCYLIGVENGYVNRQTAAEKVLRSLKFLWELPQGPERSGTAGHMGFFYHFLHMANGTRFLDVELSTIDTALLLAGVMTCYSYFDKANDPVEADIRSFAEKIYTRVDWNWFVVKGTHLLSMGWHPESGFLDAIWSGYNEGMIIYVLGMGSPNNTLTAASWEEWTKTYVWANYLGYEHVNFGPLFGHQYSHMYVDFRGIKDAYMEKKGIDYFINSQRATLSNKAYCKNNIFWFKDYTENIWGLTACDGPSEERRYVNGREVAFKSYTARGAAIDYQNDDGTIAPTSAGGSIPFAPEECLAALKAMYAKYGSLVYGEYGFKDSFNPTYVFGDSNKFGWFDQDYIGIDEGPILIQLENYQTEFVWKLLRKNKFIINGLRRAGFKGGWLDKAEVTE